MSVKLKCWSEDGEEVIDVPQSQLVAQFAPHAVSPQPKRAVEVSEPPIKWTMPDEPDAYADYA